MRGQSPRGIRGPTVAIAGSTITIQVGPNDTSVQVTDPATQKVKTYDVSPGKDTPIPLPDAPPGTVVRIRTGRGINARFLLVEIVSTGP